jgi:hypothetical protein
MSSTATATAPTSAPATSARAGRSLGPQAAVAAIVLAAFTVFSAWVVYQDGYLGFLRLAGREPWGLQLLLDLIIAASFGIAWMRADARKRGITSWPYVALVFPLGSIGILAYAVRRGLPLTPRPGT